MDVEWSRLIHVVAGTLAVIGGTVALVSAKGSFAHRVGGGLFALTMIISAGLGAQLAAGKPEFITAIAGIFTTYLVATSWLSARRANGQGGRLEIFYGLIGAGIAGFAIWATMTANAATDKQLHGYGFEAYAFFAGMSLLGVALDITVIARRGLGARHRIARHLWRMTFALFIAVGSLFTGPGAGVFPQILKDIGLLSMPEPIILALLLFWLARVLFTGWARKIN